MNKFPFQINNTSTSRHVTEKFACINVTMYKHEIEKEFQIKNLRKVLYFKIHPMVSAGIHMDMDITRNIHEKIATCYFLTETTELYLNTWRPVSNDFILYKPGPTNLDPPSKTPFIKFEHAVKVKSIQLSNNMEMDISDFHNVENKSSTDIIEFLSVRF